MMLTASAQLRPHAAARGEVAEHIDGIGYRIGQPGVRPTAAHRNVWRCRSDLLAGWLAAEWKREQAKRDKEVRQW
jgi:hypothetical protein